jgi:hypothetical protein
MATVVDAAVAARSEERFFFLLAASISAVLVAGFTLNLALGRSSFAVPLIYHVHAVIFFGWIALFLAQTSLMARGNRALHRRLGWLAALWVPAMVVAGIAMTIASMRRNGGPFFFDANEFLISNPIGLLTFAGLVGAALALRRRTDWHRRLMIGAMASITGPGFGRLLPTPLFAPWAWEITNLVGMGLSWPGWFVTGASTGRCTRPGLSPWLRAWAGSCSVNCWPIPIGVSSLPVRFWPDIPAPRVRWKHTCLDSRSGTVHLRGPPLQASRA